MNKKLTFRKLTSALKLSTATRVCLICGRKNVRKGVVVKDPEDEGVDIYDLVYCDVCVARLIRALAGPGLL